MTEPNTMARRLLEVEKKLARLPVLKDGGGDGTAGGMEARVARLEATVEHIQGDVTDVKATAGAIRTELRSDFRWLVGAIAGVALLGLGAVAWVSGKFDMVSTRFDGVAAKFETANARTDAVAERISRLETASERLRADVLDRLPPPAKPQR